MNFKVFFTFITLNFISCNTSNTIREISVENFKKKLDSGTQIQLLDVRTKSECNAGVIANAIHIDIFNDNFEKKVTQHFSKDKKIYLYCRSGGRALKASEILKKKGYNPINIEGGYKAWKARVALIK